MKKYWIFVIIAYLYLALVIFAIDVSASTRIEYCTVAKCHIHKNYNCKIITAYDETYWSADKLPKPIAQYHTFGQEYYELEEVLR
jgi:hypothetical protein